jgi:hypothetical protein
VLDEFYGPNVNTDALRQYELVHEDFSGFVGNRDYQGTWTRADVAEDNFPFEYEIHAREWMIEPNLAVVKSHETWDLTEPFECLWTIVFAKNDGEWQIIHIHMSDFH